MRRCTSTFESLSPIVIAHDVGRTKDRSTAVVGGISRFAPELIFIKDFEELQPGLYGSTRANELAAIDRRYSGRALKIVDLSNDATYAEALYDTFGRTFIGVHITRHGDGTMYEVRQVRNGGVPVYKVGRTNLLDFLHTCFREDRIRILHGPMAQRAYDQLMALEIDLREGGVVYRCPPGHHDDLAISMAMLVWILQHSHLASWMRALEPRRPVQRQSYGWGAFV